MPQHPASVGKSLTVPLQHMEGSKNTFTPKNPQLCQHLRPLMLPRTSSMAINLRVLCLIATCRWGHYDAVLRVMVGCRCWAMASVHPPTLPVQLLLKLFLSSPLTRTPVEFPSSKVLHCSRRLTRCWPRVSWKLSVNGPRDLTVGERECF